MRAISSFMPEAQSRVSVLIAKDMFSASSPSAISKNPFEIMTASVA